MANASFRGSHRKAVAASGFDMNEVLGELLSDQPQATTESCPIAA
jgi:hypothetical protein